MRGPSTASSNETGSPFANGTIRSARGPMWSSTASGAAAAVTAGLGIVGTCIGSALRIGAARCAPVTSGG